MRKTLIFLSFIALVLVSLHAGDQLFWIFNHSVTPGAADAAIVLGVLLLIVGFSLSRKLAKLFFKTSPAKKESESNA